MLTSLLMENERAYRQEIVEICRLLYEKNLMSSTDGNVSVRVDKDHLLITPSGVHKGFLKPEELILTDMKGERVSGTGRPSQEILMHLCSYQERPEIRAVLHAHPVHCIAMTLAGMDLRGNYLPEVILSVGEIPVIPYTTPTTEEVPRMIREYVRKYDAMILDRHGALTIGKNLMEAFCKMERLEHVAQTVVIAKQLGNLKPLTAEELQKLKQMR